MSKSTKSPKSQLSGNEGAKKPSKKEEGTIVVVAEKGATTIARPSAKQTAAALAGRELLHHANGAEFSNKRPGVIACIVEMLTDASEKHPVTKKEILTRLVTLFPERAEAGMKATLMMQVPSGLKIEKRMIVASNEHGYWVDEKGTAKCQADYAAAKERAKEEAKVAAEKAAKEAAKGSKSKK